MKRIVALFSAVLLALSAVPALARAEGATTLTVTADKTVTAPGDKITFSVVLGPVSNLGGLSIHLDIPEGMTIDEGSAVVPDGVEEILDMDGKPNVPKESNDRVLDYSAQRTGYTGTSDLCILKFTCTVDPAITLGKKSVGIRTDIPTDGPFDQNVEDIAWTARPVVVQIEKAGSPTVTPAPTVTPDPTATPAPTAKPAATPEASSYFLADLADLIEQVEAGSTIRISKKNNINTLDRNVLRRLNERGVSLEMEYTYEDKDYKIFIPAGKAVIDDDVFYCGPLYLAGLYGSNSMSSGPEGIIQGAGQALMQIVNLYF